MWPIALDVVSYLCQHQAVHETVDEKGFLTRNIPSGISTTYVEYLPFAWIDQTRWIHFHFILPKWPSSGPGYFNFKLL